MAKAHIKKGDEVVVITGSELGKRGKVMSVNKKKSRVLVEGLKMIKRHTRKSDKHPQGAIVEREGTIHLSNIMLAATYDQRPSRAGQTKETASAPAPAPTPAK